MRDRHCRIVDLSIAGKRLEIATCKTDSFPRVGRFLHSWPHARKPLEDRGCQRVSRNGSNRPDSYLVNFPDTRYDITEDLNNFSTC